MEAKDKFYDLLKKLKEVDNVKLFINEMLECSGYIWGGRNTELGISVRDSYRKYWGDVNNEMELYIKSFIKDFNEQLPLK
jgi:hypothetical protein